METIGDRIKKARIKKGLTQQEVGNYLCVSDRAVSKWEQGKSNPDITLISKIVELLDVSFEYLFGVKETRNKEGGDDLIKYIEKIISPKELTYLQRTRVKEYEKRCELNLLIECINISTKYLARNANGELLDDSIDEMLNKLSVIIKNKTQNIVVQKINKIIHTTEIRFSSTCHYFDNVKLKAMIYEYLKKYKKMPDENIVSKIERELEPAIGGAKNWTELKEVFNNLSEENELEQQENIFTTTPLCKKENDELKEAYLKGHYNTTSYLMRRIIEVLLFTTIALSEKHELIFDNDQYKTLTYVIDNIDTLFIGIFSQEETTLIKEFELFGTHRDLEILIDNYPKKTIDEKVSSFNSLVICLTNKIYNFNTKNNN